MDNRDYKEGKVIVVHPDGKIDTVSINDSDVDSFVYNVCGTEPWEDECFKGNCVILYEMFGNGKPVYPNKILSDALQLKEGMIELADDVVFCQTNGASWRALNTKEYELVMGELEHIYGKAEAEA